MWEKYEKCKFIAARLEIAAAIERKRENRKAKRLFEICITPSVIVLFLSKWSKVVPNVFRGTPRFRFGEMIAVDREISSDGIVTKPAIETNSFFFFFSFGISLNDA